MTTDEGALALRHRPSNVKGLRRGNADTTSFTAAAAEERLGCEPTTDDCRAQISAAAPVDARLYAEARAAFERRIRAQGASFATRLALLRRAREAASQPSRKGIRNGRRGAAGEPDCTGLLEGGGDAALQLCTQVNVDAHYRVVRSVLAQPSDDSMHSDQG